MSGILSPFRRDRKRDFASGDGDDLLASKVEQVLTTEGATNGTSGELPWRTSFGTPLQLLRHRRNDAVLEELARVYVRDALRKWLNATEVVDVSTSQTGSELALRVKVTLGAQDRILTLNALQHDR